MNESISASGAEDIIRREISDECKTQPPEVKGTAVSDGSVGVFLTDYPNIHKGTTDKVADIGWRLSGITQDSDGTVNLYFRPLE